MNMTEHCEKAGITLPTLNNFLTGKHSIGLLTFRKLVNLKNRKILDKIIAETKVEIKKESGKKVKINLDKCQ